MIFQNRIQAGEELGKFLAKDLKDNKDVVIIGLPRGGIIVAYAVAKELNCPLDIIVPRKISAPDNPEFAIGAITEDGNGIFNKEIISTYRIPPEYIRKEAEKEMADAKRRLSLYRRGKGQFEVSNKIVIIVDDGIATGLTMLAAINYIKKFKTKKIIVAVPVIPEDTLKKIEKEAKIYYLDTPIYFDAVGSFYKEFDQTTDKEVIDTMRKF